MLKLQKRPKCTDYTNTTKTPNTPIVTQKVKQKKSQANAQDSLVIVICKLSIVN